MQPTIQEANIHYGIPTVWVEPYRTTDDRDGRPVEVHSFYTNGCLTTVEGFRVRKDGGTYLTSQCLAVGIPNNVRAALAALGEEKT
jgi:hypothetical protein